MKPPAEQQGWSLSMAGAGAGKTIGAWAPQAHPGKLRITVTEFLERLRELEAQMNAQAIADGNLFMPSLAPKGPVDYVVVGQEPSLGRWPRNQDPKEMLRAGYRSIHPANVHFAVRRYLLKSGDGYCVTDIAKGAMYGKQANTDKDEREKRWDRWWPLLEKEFALLAKPKTRIFALGEKVNDYLRRHRCQPIPLRHYAALERPNLREAALARYKAPFERFKSSVSFQDVSAVWQVVLNESVPARFHDQERGYLIARWSHPYWAEVELATIFIYKLAFESARQDSIQTAVLTTA